MSNELKPCPFCGGAVDRLDKGAIGFASGDGLKYVVCPCGAMGAGGKTEAEAIEAWNRRATSGAPSGEVPEALRKWALLREDGLTNWECGYESARSFVKMQLANVAPAEQSAPPVPRMGGITNDAINLLSRARSAIEQSDRERWSGLTLDISRFLATQSASTAPGQADGDEDSQFEAWWAAHGQFCRAGGGDYEKTFAYRAWQARGKQIWAIAALSKEKP